MLDPLNTPSLRPSVHTAYAPEHTKPCKTCSERKSLTEFPPHRRSRDGRRVTCRDCLLSGRYRPQSETPHARDLRRARHSRPEWKRSHAEAVARWQALEPVKHEAGVALQRALRHGHVVKAKRCQAAGCDATKKLHGHHPSYRKEHFLTVLWTCPKCHLRGHAAGFIPTAPGVPSWLGQIPSVAVASTAEAGGRHARHH